MDPLGKPFAMRGRGPLRADAGGPGALAALGPGGSPGFRRSGCSYMYLQIKIQKQEYI